MTIRAALRLRPMTDDDYPRLAEIRNAAYPDMPMGEDQLRYWDSVWDERTYDRLRLTAEDGAGTIVGFGQLNHMPEQFHPRKYGCFIVVDPPRWRQGIGSVIWERLLAELTQRHALLTRTEAKETMAASLEFLAKRGFVEVQRYWESRLDVERFDVATFAGAEERAAGQGIAFTTLAAERKRDPDVLHKVYELYRTCERDIPMVEPITNTSYEHFLSHEIEAPNALPEAFFLAKDGERLVALSNMFRNQELDHVLQQGLTAVLPEYRGRGIAMALKLRTVRYAKEHGRREIRTWNNTRNRPMLRINEAMGFAKQPVWIEFEKRL